ncbi:MAG: hypothetical protein U0166_26965 [Acidobacteriota bacterium]
MPALIDQVLWSRAFARVFGSSTFAVATVLAAFMVGLAAGSFRGVARSDPPPAQVYAMLEAGIALFAFGSLPLIEAVWSGRPVARGSRGPGRGAHRGPLRDELRDPPRPHRADGRHVPDARHARRIGWRAGITPSSSTA